MIIIEIQHSNDGSTAITTPVVEADSNKAEQTYHNKLAYAAVSKVNVHSVVMMDDYGARVKGETYYHGSDDAE